MVKLDSGVRRFDTVFVVVLLTLFAITASLLVMISAKQYNLTTQKVNTNYETRTISSYLREKIRQSDSAGSVSIQEVDGLNMIAMVQTLDTGSYYTYIYAYEGYLYEIFVREGTSFSPATGQKIMPISRFTASIDANNIMYINYTSSSGEKREVVISLMAEKGVDADE